MYHIKQLVITTQSALRYVKNKCWARTHSWLFPLLVNFSILQSGNHTFIVLTMLKVFDTSNWWAGENGTQFVCDSSIVTPQLSILVSFWTVVWIKSLWYLPGRKSIYFVYFSLKICCVYFLEFSCTGNSETISTHNMILGGNLEISFYIVLTTEAMNQDEKWVWLKYLMLMLMLLYHRKEYWSAVTSRFPFFLCILFHHIFCLQWGII